MTTETTESASAGTDLLIEEAAAASRMTRESIVTRLANLDADKLAVLAEITADLLVRNVLAGMAPQAAHDAAHRRTGRELGLAIDNAVRAELGPISLPDPA